MVGGYNVNIWEAKPRYMGDGRGCLLRTLPSMVRPGLAREGVRLHRVALPWMRCIEAFGNFLSPNSKELQVATMPVKVSTRDLHLRPKKDHTDPK